MPATFDDNEFSDDPRDYFDDTRAKSTRPPQRRRAPRWEDLSAGEQDEQDRGAAQSERYANLASEY